MPTFDQILAAAKKLPPKQQSLDWQYRQQPAQEDLAAFGLPTYNEDPTANWDYKTATAGPNGESAIEGQVGWTPNGERYFGGDSDLANWWNGLMYRLRAPLKREGQEVDYEDVSSLDPGKIWETTARATGEVLGGVLGVLSLPGQALERFRSGLDRAAGIKNEASSQEWGWFNFARDLIDNIARVPGEVAGGAAAFIQNPQKAAEQFGEGWREGRIYYSNIGDPVRQAEYQRRLRAGENPYLLSQELSEPVNEFFGQLVFDPTWLAGLVTKPLREMGIVDNIADDVLRAVPENGIRAEFDALKAAKEGGKVFGTADAAGSLDNLMGKISEANAARPAALKAADSRIVAVERKGILPRFFSPRTPTSQKNFATQDFAAIFGRVFASTAGDANKIDGALDVMNAIVKITTETDKAELLKAAATLEHFGFPVEVALSKAGTRSGLLMKKIMEYGDVNLLEDIRHATTGVDIIDAFGKVMTKALDAVYPSNLDLKGLSGAARRLLDTPFYKKQYEFFGSMYMSNPAFVARSFGVDVITLTTDAGAGSLKGLFHIGTLDDEVGKMFGRIPPGYAEGFSGISGAADNPTVAKGFFAKWRNAANVNQQKISKISFHYAARRFMEQGYGTMFKATIPKLASSADLSDEMIAALRKYTVETGSPKLAKEMLLRDIDAGYIDGKQMTWLDDVMDGHLGDFGFAPSWKRAVRESATLDEALAGHKRVLDGALAEARKAGLQAMEAGLAETDDVLGHGDALLEAAAEGLSGKVSNAMSHFKSVANKEIEFQAGELFKEIQSIASRYGIDDIRKLVPEELKGVTSLDGEWLNAQRLKLTAKWKNMRSWYKRMRDADAPDLKRYWEQFIKMGGDFPEGMSKSSVVSYFWDGFYFPASAADYASMTRRYLDNVTEALAAIQNSERVPEIGELVTSRLNSLRDAVDYAAKLATRTFSPVTGTLVDNGNLTDVLRLAFKNNVNRKALLSTINKYLPEGVAKFTDETLIPYEIAEAALRRRAAEKGIEIVELGKRLTDGVPTMTDEIVRISRRADGGHVFTPQRWLAEQEAGIRGLFTELEKALRANYSNAIPTSPRTLELEAALNAWEKTATPMVNELTIMAEKYGTAYRDLVVLPYTTGKTNLDTVLSLVYPYSFWPSRTYVNWARRIAYNPALFRAYGSYRDTMQQIHRDSPEWYKYSLRSDEMFGLFPDNPIFFNLESQFNPVNGLTGVDFNDPQKRVNWWTSAIDNLGKWGSSPWAFINIATALALKAQGDNDAAARWAGRLGPQSQWVRGAVSLASGGQTVAELDPLVMLFGNGMDPYVRESGIPRALAQMELDGKYTHDQLLDAASQQSGPIWDEAYRRAIADRAPGNVISAFLGGVRPRTIADLQADQYYNAQQRVFAQRDFVSPDAYRQMWDSLRQQYPFADAMLLAKQDGEDRDAAIAYNVLSRIPPGSIPEITGAIGMNSDLVSQFYDSKGDFAEWSEGDKMRFMAGIVDLQAILATPSDSTRQEWSQVRTLYSQMLDATKAQFGDDILVQIDQYFSDHQINPDVRPSQLVQQALDYQTAVKANNQLLATYYGGITAISKYYESLMYQELRTQYPEAASLWNEYWNLPSDQRSRFIRANKELQGYLDLRDQWQSRIDQAIVQLGNYLPEAKGAEIRTDVPLQSQAQEQAAMQIVAPIRIDERDLVLSIGESAYGIVQDFLNGGAPLPYSVRNKLNDYADRMGVDFYTLLNILNQPAVIQ